MSGIKKLFEETDAIDYNKENIFQKYNRLNKIMVHAAKYNRKNLKPKSNIRFARLNEDTFYIDFKNKQDEFENLTRKEMRFNYQDLTNEIWSQLKIPIKSFYNHNKVKVSLHCKILNCISFHRYKPGTIFNILIGRQLISTYTLTKENRFDMFIPLDNKYPIFGACLSYHEVEIESPNAILNRPIHIYATEIKNYREMSLTANVQNTIVKFDDGRYFAYSSGMAGFHS